MIISLLNWIVVGFLGGFRILRREGVFVALIATSASSCLFLLSRVDTALKVGVFGQNHTILELSPFLLVVLALIRGRISEWSIRLFALVWLLITVAIGAFIVEGEQLGWTVYSLNAVVGPILLGICASTLTQDQARVLLMRLEHLIVTLAILSIVSVIGAASVSAFMGWEFVPRRILSPVGSPIATGSIVLLLFPKALDAVVYDRSWRSLIILGIVSTSLLLSGSRAVVFTAVAIGMFVLIRANLRSGTLSNIIGRYTAVLSGGGLVIVLFLSISDYSAVARLSADIGQYSGDELRIESLSASLDQISRRPLAGSVPGHIYPWFRTEYIIGQVPITTVAGRVSLVEPHNLFTFIGVEYGLISMIVFLMVIASMAVVLYRSRVRGVSIYGISLVGFMAQSVGTTSLAINPRVASIFWLIAVSAVMVVRRGRESDSFPQSWYCQAGRNNRLFP